MFFCMANDPKHIATTVYGIFIRQIISNLANRKGSVEEWYSENLKPALFYEKYGLDGELISKHLSRINISELNELSSLIESDYRFMKNLKKFSDELGKKVDLSYKGK